MTAHSFLVDVLFPGAIIASVVAWGVALCFGIFEDVAIQRFVPWVFRVGPRVLKRTIPLRRPSWPDAGSAPIGMRCGVVKLISPTEGLVRQPFVNVPSRFYSRGISPKGIISWRGSQGACLECRLSPGLLLFLGAWLTILAAAGGRFAMAGRPLAGVIVLLVGWGLTVLGYRSSAKTARLWAEEVVAELSNALPLDAATGSHSAADAHRPRS